MRAVLPFVLLIAAVAQAQPADPTIVAADVARTTDLNRAIQQNNDSIAQRNAAAQATYAAERAAYERARAENDRERQAAADAARAYELAQKAHQADIARYDAQVADYSAAKSAKTTKPAKPVKAAAAKPAAANCQMDVATGSIMRKVRTCTDTRTSDAQRAALQRDLRPPQ